MGRCNWVKCETVSHPELFSWACNVYCAVQCVIPGQSNAVSAKGKVDCNHWSNLTKVWGKYFVGTSFVGKVKAKGIEAKCYRNLTEFGMGLRKYSAIRICYALTQSRDGGQQWNEMEGSDWYLSGLDCTQPDFLCNCDFRFLCFSGYQRDMTYHIISSSARYGPGPNQVVLKKTDFLGFLSVCFFAAGVTDTKVLHSTGVATTSSTNKNPNANKLSWAINWESSGIGMGIWDPPAPSLFSMDVPHSVQPLYN